MTPLAAKGYTALALLWRQIGVEAVLAPLFAPAGSTEKVTRSM